MDGSLVDFKSGIIFNDSLKIKVSFFAEKLLKDAAILVIIILYSLNLVFILSLFIPDPKLIV